MLLRPPTPVSGPAEARIWGTPTGYLLGKNYLGFAPRDKVVGLVASTVQDFYARLIGSAVQKLQAQNHYSSHGHVEDVNMTNQIK